LLIADEPTTALDVTIQAQILELIMELQQRLRMAVLLITHDLGVVAGTCDRVAVMYAGRLAETATAEVLFSDPAHPYSAGLLRSTPRLDETETRLVAIDGSPPDMARPPPGCPFAPRCQHRADRCETDLPQLTPLSTIDADQPTNSGRSVACWHPLIGQPSHG